LPATGIGGVAIVKVDARQILQDKESYYRPKLDAASLVVEADYSATDVTNILKAFGFVHSWYTRQGLAEEAVFQKHLNCLLIGMVGTAAIAPEHTFWPEFWASTGIAPSGDLQSRVGDLFLQALSHRRLRTFSDVVKRHRFVGPAGMHAAIPTSGMPGLVDVVLSRRRADPSLTGARLLSWLLAVDTRLHAVDRTVERFLLHGGELALDVLDRIIEVVEYVGEHPASLDDGTLTNDTTGLPEVMLKALLASLRGRLDEVQAQPVARSRSAVQEECTVGLDLAAGAVTLRLPSVSAAQGPAVWTVAADGEKSDVRGRPHWVGDTARTEAVSTRLQRPARSINVRLRGEVHADLALVDPADPLLVFDLDGTLLPPALPLPRGELWVVLPDDRQLEDSTGTPVRQISSLGSPVGWSGWEIRQIDVGAVDGVRASSVGDPGRLRTIRSSGGPSFAAAQASSVLKTRRGAEVLTERPVVLVPAGSDPAQWRVEVTHTIAGTRTPTQRFSLAKCPVVGDGFDPLDRFPAPLLGDYFVSVRGAFGKKTQRLMAIAEGLHVEVEPDLRLPVNGGVREATVTLSAGPAMELSTHSISFGIDKLQAEVDCTVDGRAERLVVSPPRVQIRVDSDEPALGWTFTAQLLHPELLEHPTTLTVHIPDDGDNYRLVFAASSGDERQSLESSARSGQRNKMYDLTKFADTARRSRSGRFDLVSTRRSFAVAHLRPQRFAAAATAIPDGVQLDGYQHTDDVTAAVYLETAPWVEPSQLPVSETGTITLPPELRASGALRIELAVVDPWVPAVWPEWPSEHAVTCAQPGFHHGGAEGSWPLSKLLAGIEVPPDAAISDLSAVWSTYQLLDRLRLTDDVVEAVQRAMTDALHREPGTALVSLANSTSDHAATVGLLIRTRLIERRFKGVSEEDLAGMWATSPVAAALAAAPHCTGETQRTAQFELLAAVGLHGGEALVEILTTGRDQHREAGRFDASATALDAMSAWQVNELWSAVQVVPEGLLHPGSRLAAAKQLFDARKARDLAAFSELVSQDLPRSRRLLNEVASPAVRAQLDARLDSTPAASWGLLPAASFAWAAQARLRARNSVALSAMSPARRKAWRTLAQFAPDYVGMDIVLADALVQSSHSPTEK